MFVGIGPEADVEAFLAGVPHDEVTDVDYEPFSADYRRENPAGTARPGAPADESFWVASASGNATQTVTWDLEPGQWSIVVMNADGSAAVASDIELGGQIDYLAWIAIGLGLAGVAFLAIGAAMIVGGVVVRPAAPGFEPAAATTWPSATDGATYPVRIEGDLDPGLSRWKWLVKWILAIPHLVILALLWVAFAVLSIVAFFAILFTGRYPRSIFDFNVGVLRWTWRVSYYGGSALGTDRYPPFTLADAEYPARLDIDYPERMSRGLVLVKSWLLAIPHLMIVGAFVATSWTLGGDRGDAAGFVLGGGLLGIAVVVVAFALLFTGRYPRGLHGLIMGINRWIYRVIAYVALMTDEYPPFRLDQGGTEPDGSGPPPGGSGSGMASVHPGTVPEREEVSA